jgi:hypothetical protein
MKTRKSTQTMTTKEFEELGRDMWSIYELNYKNRKRMYMFTFVKGVMQGFGIFIGGTIIVALLIYGLSFFNKVPVVDKIYNALTNPTSIQQQKP